MDNADKIRVQFEDFKLDHFETSPIWEFAIDEEGEEDQDESTLKPRLDLEDADPSEGLLIIQCKFETKSGQKYKGLCSAPMENTFDEIQPYIFKESEMLPFYFGISEPDKDEKNKIYRHFGLTPEKLFPINFTSLTKVNGSFISGKIEGFMWRTLSNPKIMIDK